MVYRDVAFHDVVLYVVVFDVYDFQHLVDAVFLATLIAA